MRALRKSLQVVALVGTLMVGIVAVALIVSQTPWFRDWLRRYIVRESKQYLNGELSIGRIGGNLLFGVEVSDIAVDVSGERVVAVKAHRGRLQRLSAHLEGRRPQRDQAGRAGVRSSNATARAGTSRSW